MQAWRRLGLVIGLWAAPLACTAGPFAQNVYVLSSQGGGLGYIDREVILFSRIAGASGPAIWIAERRRDNQRLRETIADHQWIDGRSCPALATVLAGINSLPAMKFSAPDGAQPTGLAFDVPMTTLSGPPALQSDEAISLSRSEFIGPVAKWAYASKGQLAGCWRDAPVQIDGVDMTPRLTTEADAAGYLR